MLDNVPVPPGPFTCDRRGGTGGRAVAQLAVAVRAPGVDVAVRGQGQGVVGSQPAMATMLDNVPVPPGPSTSTGVVALVVEPLPSWP